MEYSLDKISTIPGCEVLVTSAQKKKQNLERKGRNLAASIDAFRKHIDYIKTESAVVQILLKAYSEAYNILSDGGKDRAHMNVKVKQTELRQAQLEKKAFTYNMRALFVKELEYNVLRNQISVIDDYISAVQNHIEALRNGPVANPASAVLQPLIVPSKPRPGKRVHKMLAKFEALSQNQVPSRRQIGAGPAKKNLISKNTLKELGISSLRKGTGLNN